MKRSNLLLHKRLLRSFLPRNDIAVKVIASEVKQSEFIYNLVSLTNTIPFSLIKFLTSLANSDISFCSVETISNEE